MPRPARTSLALALTAAAVGLAACGGGDEGTIPPQNAQELENALAAVEAAVEDGECTTAETDMAQLSDAVFRLPKAVGADTKDDLRTLVDNLDGLVEQECEDGEPDVTEPPDTGATGVEGDD